MSESIALALKLMVVGMSTVFFILLLVILIGNLIIGFSNRFEAASKTVQKNSIDKNHQLAIKTAISQLSNGAKVVKSIERIN